MTEAPKVVPLASRAREIELYRLDAIPERPRREEIVEGLIAAGEIVAFVGRPGVGKTAILARLAISLAEGSDFLGRQVVQGPVIYVAAEKGEEVKRRLLAIRRRTTAPVYVTTQRPNLANIADMGSLADAIDGVCEKERHCPALIIIDTLARSMPSLNEDRAVDAAKVVEGLTSLLERIPTASVLFAHHVTKNSGGIRGSSAFEGGADLLLAVERGKGGGGRIIVEKANAVPEEQALDFTLKAVEYRESHDAAPEEVIAAFAADDEIPEPAAGGAPAKSVAALPKQARDLLALLETIMPTRRDEARDIARAAGLFTGVNNTTRMAFNRALERLTAAGLITEDEYGMIDRR